MNKNTPAKIWENFQDKLLPPNDEGCRIFDGQLHSGYGVFHPHGRERATSHRWLWEQVLGSIPDGLVLDHDCHNEAAIAGTCLGGMTCRHRACCTLTHLMPKTIGDNCLASPMSVLSIRKAATRCVNGHRFTVENTHWCGPNRTYRQCRICSAASAKRWRERNPREKKG